MARRIIQVGFHKGSGGRVTLASNDSRRGRVTAVVAAALVVVGLLLVSAVSGIDLLSYLGSLSANADEVPAAETAAAQSQAAEATPSDKASDYAAIAAAPTDANGLAAAKVTWVSDGDTLRVELNGATIHVRLLGIDTPESVAYDTSQNSDQGKQAARHTEGLVRVGDTVWLQSGSVDHDRYGRILRWAWLQEPNDPSNEGEVRAKMLDAIILRDGYAKTFWLEGQYEELFERLEAEARESGAGLWATGSDWGRTEG